MVPPTSPSEVLRGHDWIGLLARREISRLPIRGGRTVASSWIFFLLTVARAASDFHRSSRSSNHDELIKYQGHSREAKPGCQVYSDFVRSRGNSGTGPEFFSKVLVFLENSWGWHRILYLRRFNPRRASLRVSFSVFWGTESSSTCW